MRIALCNVRSMVKLCRAVQPGFPVHLPKPYLRQLSVSLRIGQCRGSPHVQAGGNLRRASRKSFGQRGQIKDFSTEAARVVEADSLTNPTPEFCSGCGVKLQGHEPDLPGYFSIPKQKELVQKGLAISEDEEAILRTSAAPSPSRTKADLIDEPDATSISGRSRKGQDREVSSTRRDSRDDENFWQDQSSRIIPGGPSFGDDSQDDEEPVLLCARCYSLQHYGKVKSQAAEAALPAFDLGKKVGQKIALQKFRTPIVLCVVDLADFDGSLPRKALLSLLPRSMLDGAREREAQIGWSSTPRQGGMDACKLVLVCNKADLLPKQVSLTRVQAWARKRVQEAGLPVPSSIHMISSTKQLGVKDLLSELQQSAGMAGDVWVVGAQNAGKSSLINAMRRVVGKKSKTKDVTTAPLLGTTLGMLRIDGIMTGRNRMFDTPGVPHKHQLSAMLTPDEAKLLLPNTRLVPRTFRASEGQSILIGGVGRIDVVQISKQTLYLTVWASSHIKCHYGKTEGVEERYTKMAGSTLVPPVGSQNRLDKLGPLVPANLLVEGQDWKGSSTDIAIAGLGWIGIGLNGEAKLRVWSYDGVAITRRKALIPDYSADLQRPGLSDKSLKAPKAAKRRS